MRNIKALALTVQKLLARLQFSKNGSNSKVNVTIFNTNHLISNYEPIEMNFEAIIKKEKCI